MKKTLTALLLVLGLAFFPITPAIAQVGPVVTSASFIEWDYQAGLEGTVEGFRVYISQTPNIVPDGVSFTSTVLYPTKQLVITGAPGQYYAVVTAYTVGGVESGPSNEVAYFILEPPTNLRITIP